MIYWEAEAMTLDQLTEFFKWMTILNIVIFILSAILIIIFKKIVCRIHGILFGLKEEEVSIISYEYLGTYRVLILVLNIVPYISLVCMKQ